MKQKHRQSPAYENAIPKVLWIKKLKPVSHFPWQQHCKAKQTSQTTLQKDSLIPYYTWIIVLFKEYNQTLPIMFLGKCFHGFKWDVNNISLLQVDLEIPLLLLLNIEESGEKKLATLFSSLHALGPGLVG